MSSIYFEESLGAEYDSDYDVRDDYAPEEIYPFEEPEEVSSDYLPDERYWVELDSAA